MTENNDFVRGFKEAQAQIIQLLKVVDAWIDHGTKSYASSAEIEARINALKPEIRKQERP